MSDRTVVGLGTAGWEAGTDIFLDLARRLADEERLRWCWAGPRSRGAIRRLENDEQQLGLADRIHWVEDADALDPPSLLVVTARTERAVADATRGALAAVTVGFDLADPVGRNAAPEMHRVPYPDVAALADALRRQLRILDSEDAR